VGRFIAPDTPAPGAGALTAAPHDVTATTAWRGAATTGPQNPQDLNRSTYANNNPMRYNDPSGQCVGPVIVYCVGVGAKALFDAATVVIGGYLIYDGMQQIAEGAGTSPALPIEGTGVDRASVGGAGELAGATGATTEEADKLYERTGWRKSVPEKALSEAPTNEEGNPICPTCGEVLEKERTVETKNGPVVQRGYDVDHYPDTCRAFALFQEHSIILNIFRYYLTFE
jgi:hypothetical protein